MTNEHDSETSFSTILTMSQYTPKERAEIVAFYIENNRSIVKTFPGHVVSKNGDLEWPPRSPDLTVPDLVMTICRFAKRHNQEEEELYLTFFFGVI